MAVSEKTSRDNARALELSERQRKFVHDAIGAGFTVSQALFMWDFLSLKGHAHDTPTELMKF